MKYTPRLDDATQGAGFDVPHREEAAVSGGTLKFAGVGGRDAANLQKKGRPKLGDVFATSYGAQFEIEETFPVHRRDASSQKRAAMELWSDPDKRTVDVKCCSSEPLTLEEFELGAQDEVIR